MDHTKHWARLGLLLCACLLTSPALAKDCDNPKTRTDCIIHADEHLAALANETSKAYEQRLASIDDEEKEALNYQQKHWLKGRAACVFRRSAKLTADQMLTATTCLTEHYHGYLQHLSYRCEVDEDHTVQEMATWKEPWSPKIPAGFTIDNHMVGFVVTPQNLIVSESFNLPSKHLSAARKAGGMFKYGYKDVAQCRVQDTDGHWWLAIGRKGSLAYIPEDETTTMAAYKKKVEQEHRQRPSPHGLRSPPKLDLGTMDDVSLDKDYNSTNILVSADATEVTIDNATYAVNTLDEGDEQECITGYNADMTTHGIKGTLSGCSFIISVGDASAGVCSLSNNSRAKDVAVCDDSVVGHFNIVRVNPKALTKPQLIRFLVSNCTGG